MIGEYGEFMRDEISLYFVCITQRRNASSSGHMTTADGEVSWDNIVWNGQVQTFNSKV